MTCSCKDGKLPGIPPACAPWHTAHRSANTAAPAAPGGAAAAGAATGSAAKPGTATQSAAAPNAAPLSAAPPSAAAPGAAAPGANLAAPRPRHAVSALLLINGHTQNDRHRAGVGLALRAETPG